MDKKSLISLLDRIYNADQPAREDLIQVLELADGVLLETLYEYADKVRKEFTGDGILVRGIVEFSSFCRNTCLYCGLYAGNSELKRFRLSKDEILAGAQKIWDSGISTVVLQAGEDGDLDIDWFADVIRSIKQMFDGQMAMTLSVGEYSRESYAKWRDAGADRFLLKIETSDQELYAKMHPRMSFGNRVRCIDNLKELGYQTGGGSLIGLPGQTIESLADDVLFYKRHKLDMIGIGLFIPHEATPLKDEPHGSLELTLKMLALTRIVTKHTNLPATTATGSIGEGDNRIRAMQSGANVLMPNFTPLEFKKLYNIYPKKRCVKEANLNNLEYIEMVAKNLGRYVDLSRGDVFKD